MDMLALALRPWAGRSVVNKTGLSGSYHATMNFDMFAARRGPDPDASTPGAAPSVFTALQEQLGLKLQSKTSPADVLVIDRVKRPTAN